MRHAGIDRGEMARRLPCSVQAVGDVIRGKAAAFSLDRHFKAALICKVNQHWLYSGEGDMLDMSAPQIPTEMTNLALELALYFDEMLPTSVGREVRTRTFNALSDLIADAKRKRDEPRNGEPPESPSQGTPS